MKLCILVVAGVLGLMPAASALADCPTQFPSIREHVPLQIDAHHGKRRFDVEVARSDNQQERGLMCRAHLDSNKGMIFPMAQPHPAAFWMKNTMIPLDIIFIKPDGRIESIARNAKPYDLTPLASGGSVSAVLEVAGGTTLRMGIKPGDKVVW
jgi:uncharacterized membrane protein (UPF0127 family)